VRQLTDQLLHGIAAHRVTVVVTDIAAVPLLEPTFANQLMQFVQAAHPLVGTAILTGLSPQVAQAIVTLRIDLGEMRTATDLQGGIEVPSAASSGRPCRL
jgi:rsbT co-antagonist protein RsbR